MGYYLEGQSHQRIWPRTIGLPQQGPFALSLPTSLVWSSVSHGGWPHSQGYPVCRNGCNSPIGRPALRYKDVCKRNMKTRYKPKRLGSACGRALCVKYVTEFEEGKKGNYNNWKTKEAAGKRDSKTKLTTRRLILSATVVAETAKHRLCCWVTPDAAANETQLNK